MEDKIINDINELSDEAKEARKRIDESCDRMIAKCEDLLAHLKRIEDKVDRWIEQ
jgi:hypothetical protein